MIGRVRFINILAWQRALTTHYLPYRFHYHSLSLLKVKMTESFHDGKRSKKAPSKEGYLYKRK